MDDAISIRISGLVQGVGFRPFIRRLALEHKLCGWVDNRQDGVYIHAEGQSDALSAFISDIEQRKPLAASIASIELSTADFKAYPDFTIVKSRESKNDNEITEVSPDIAVCSECLADMENQPHRLAYPFINCTNCGPRFSIIRELPYDRDKTTMSPFPMCETCKSEYNNIDDRRYHAQPVACNYCGPGYLLSTNGSIFTKTELILQQLRNVLEDGGVVAIKGLGGYNLMCDAKQDAAVLKLREFKNRDSKPFAVMFSSESSLLKYAKADEAELEILRSWQRPIVICEANTGLAASVSNGFPTVGAMLPYMPMHHLIFRHCSCDALVMTSGNISEEPIIIGDKEASVTFVRGIDAILSHNREIHNRCDDSVIRVIDQSPALIRRSRSWAPSPIRINLNVEGIFATGAELSNCFAMGRGSQAIFSQHIGDLKNLDTLEFYEETFERFSRLFRFSPSLVACDLHPDYLSTRFALSLGVPVLQFQHHHAHIAACMADNNFFDPVIGIALDGTGLGSDGHIWGSEFMICDLHSYERQAHFDYIPLPGGDKVVDQPWRTALSYITRYYGTAGRAIFRRMKAFQSITDTDFDLIAQSIERKINAPMSCGAGRLFDAVAAILGLCQRPGFHAEAPMRLESAASAHFEGLYPIETADSISFKSLFDAIFNDLESNVAIPIIARRFHQSLADLIIRQAELISGRSSIQTIALSGGVFQNKLLGEMVATGLRARGLNVLKHRQAGPGDGGIALGQLALAAANRNLKY
jgi:hydrogenase maturation protein HypF